VPRFLEWSRMGRNVPWNRRPRHVARNRVNFRA
jgi:hypothetical protein